MKVRILQVAKLRGSPGYLGKAPGDVLGMAEIADCYEVHGEPVAADDLSWLNVSHKGLSYWVAERSPDGSQIAAAVDPAESDFERAFHFAMKHEGGAIMTEDPHDLGGRTKYGIAQRFNPDVDVANLTEERAKEIYRQRYWLAAKANELPWPLNLTHFDFAVNAGVGTASQALTASDGDFALYQSYRRTYYRGLTQASRYGQGWLNRVNDLERYLDYV